MKILFWGTPAYAVPSLDALMAHAASPHMKAYGAKTKDLIESRIIHVMSPT